MDVKTIIKEHGYTLEKVAEEMHINRVTLSQSLAGNPTIRTLQRVADIIGCNIGDFFREDVSTSNEAVIVCPHCGKAFKVGLNVNN